MLKADMSIPTLTEQNHRWELARTGDIVLHSNNTSTGFLLRAATSSMYNHASIALRVNEEGKLVLDNSGKLYLLEINTDNRYDPLLGEYCTGMGVSEAEWCFARYNTNMIRKLHDRFRNEKLLKLTEKFILTYRGWQFTKSFLPFISVFIGVPFDNRSQPDKSNKQIFCTELVVKYFEEAVAPQFVDFTGIEYKGDLEEIFGKGSSKRCDLYSPETLSSRLTPYSPVLANHEIMIQKEEADGGVVLYQPVIIILVILVFMFYVLRY